MVSKEYCRFILENCSEDNNNFCSVIWFSDDETNGTVDNKVNPTMGKEDGKKGTRSW